MKTSGPRCGFVRAWFASTNFITVHRDFEHRVDVIPVDNYFVPESFYHFALKPRVATFKVVT